ncbi:DUF3983 domain-containing protein [Neobacillus mesonae]|nr:DUF3983 domain-containing protein [Neobacillus mesonae]MCM3567873.1 DUF3983 domain-containing protein [Neobacillus mesonae]
MKNKRKQKRRLKKAIKRRGKDVVKTCWRNIFVKAGILE